ncbi:unnamed protein product [Lupinus luteus]|uniref:B box-type domain-containing protein n=1 Tax=Lupinus luteus TaxID=3873 RepID=A0AAV1WP20_LUPLU
MSASFHNRPCDYCAQTKALLYCRADSAKLCFSCDREVHSTNQLFSKHTRFLLCDICDDSPATILCSTESSVLCQNCDWEKHNNSSSSSVHERRPLEGFSGCPCVNELLSIVGFEDVGKKSLLFSDLESGDGFLGYEIEEISDLFVLDAPSVVSMDDLISSSGSSHNYQAMEVPPLPKNRKVACGKHKEEVLNQLSKLAKFEPSELDTEQYVPPGNLFNGFQGDLEPDLFPSFEWHGESSEHINQVVPLQPDTSVRAYAEEFRVKHSTSVWETHTFAENGGTLTHSVMTETLATTPKPVPCELTSQERDSALLRYKQKKKTRRCDHTSANTLNPIRTLQLSVLGRGYYYDERPSRKSLC